MLFFAIFAAGNFRLAMVVAVCFYGCRRCSDIKSVKVEDIEIKDGKVEVFLEKNKTDVEVEGTIFRESFSRWSHL